MPAPELTTDEIDALVPILEALSERSRQPLTLSGLISRWEGFATQVQEGYDDSIYEYTNDLSIRDLLQEISDACNAPLREKILRSLDYYDEHFRKATTEAARPFVTQSERKRNWWWRSRVPVKLHPELEADLRSEGLLE